jgi:hypothetical protein
MTMRRILGLACVGLALAFAPAPAVAETCTADSFGDAVDTSAAELRAFSAETQPKLKAKLQALRDSKRWTDADYETKGLKLVHDAKLDAFDAEAGELLSKIDTLGSPEGVDGTATLDCESLAELKAASSELMAVMRAKSAYLISKLDREIAASPAAATPTEVARTETETKPAAQTPPPPAATAPAEPPAADVTDALSPLRRADPIKKEATPAPAPPAPPATAAQPSPPPAAQAPAKEPAPTPDVADKETDHASSWSTTTAQAVIPPPPIPREEPNYDAPPPGTPYELPPQREDGEDGEDATTFDAEGGGYTIDEIREATRGFFGTVSTSLASVIEHAFQKAGRPTAYVLGNEGGGAFLAGLRYGEGTLYLRNGGSQKVYWHGPSIGYDLGAEGSRTLFLIYDLHEPNTLFRRFTGVDGSAYLVGGVGMTLLKGGDVMMAPIRSGIGLRLGASIGYVRFSPRPTWNPF